MLSEELLRGSFHGQDTITVRVTEADGEKKLTFDAVRMADLAAPVVAGEAK